MSARSFLDTNILVYTDDSDSPEKQQRALDIYTECRQRRHVEKLEIFVQPHECECTTPARRW